MVFWAREAIRLFFVNFGVLYTGLWGSFKGAWGLHEAGLERIPMRNMAVSKIGRSYFGSLNTRDSTISGTD